MKLKNKNLIVFIAAALFIAYGLMGQLPAAVKGEILRAGEELRAGNMESVFTFRDNVDRLSTEELRYHDALMDVNSVKDRILGTRVVIKDDTVIARADSGSLIGTSGEVTAEGVFAVIDELDKLKTIAENNGAHFLYCAVPTKDCYEIPPENIRNCNRKNFNILTDCLSKSDVPYIDLSVIFEDDKIPEEKRYYMTDHHWTTLSGFYAADAICQRLASLYGFVYDKNTGIISNYEVETYKDLFLGSWGKKVGVYFAPGGADDFDLITPSFETDMIESQPFKDQVREGRFEDTVLYSENLERDYYGKNPYATYSGGDFRLQIIRNNLNPEGARILVVRDSYACVVTPFLALNASEVHVCDVRDFDFVGEKLNIADYIQEIHPDYVLVVYGGVTEVGSDKLDFY